MPQYALLAESTTASVVNELGAVLGPPTPGTILGTPCFTTKCEADGSVSGTQALYQKSAQGCHTRQGVEIDGSVYARIGGIPEFQGCSTSSGPFNFSRWPPSSGRILFAEGEPSYFTRSPTSSHPAHSLERIDGNHQNHQHWGSAQVAFQGTSDMLVTLDHWTQTTTTERSPEPIHITTASPLRLHMDSPWNDHERVFTGDATIFDSAQSATVTLSFSNVGYSKSICCHPLRGTIALTLESSPDADDGYATWTLEFKPICRQAVLRDSFGVSQALVLPACASY